MRLNRFLPLAALAATVVLSAVETLYWQHDSRADFEKATRRGLSLDDRGRLRLAPAVKELHDAALPYLWAAVRDTQGRIYYGGASGPTGKVALFELGTDGKHRVVAEWESFEIHALALNARGEIFAGTAPDGKVYKVDRNGKVDVFFDPKANYIWALLFDQRGDLYVGTGEEGRVYRVSPDGSGRVFYDTEDRHARSLALDRQGNLIVGTEPSGLVIRVDAQGKGFVLHQSERTEISSLAVSPDGSIYAAGVGQKQTARSATSTAAVAATPTPTPDPAKPQPVPSPRPTPSAASLLASSGGSELIAISPDGEPRTMWTSAKETIYSVALDGEGRPWLGTGNSGKVYRVDSASQWTEVADVHSAIITSLFAASDGRVLATTASSGRLIQLGPGLETEGVLESQTLDAEQFSRWGRLQWEGSANGGTVRLQTRSGNLDRAQKDWSPWQEISPDPQLGGRIASPSSRFVQYRVLLAPSASGMSPVLREVELAYLPKNRAPELILVEATSPNYRFPVAAGGSAPARTLSLPPIGKTNRSATPTSSSESGPSSLIYAKGMRGVRWQASDPNDDLLTFRVEIKGEGERNWKLLKDDIRERHFAFETTGFADGLYQLRVIASDKAANTPSEELTAGLTSDPFRVDNTAPVISGLRATANGNRVSISLHAEDQGSVLAKAEYSVNGGDWLLLRPSTGVIDSMAHEFSLSLEKPAVESTVAIRITDDFDNQTVSQVIVK